MLDEVRSHDTGFDLAATARISFDRNYLVIQASE